MKEKNNGHQRTKILILSANPIGTDPIRLNDEIREIEIGLRLSAYGDRFELIQKGALRIRDLWQALLDHEPHIVHFTGHGDHEGLIAEDEQGFATLVPPDTLTKLFEFHAPSIRCVILSACHSHSQAKAINKHIKYVIGMSREITVKAATEFALGFYYALGAGKTVKDAFRNGCIATGFVHAAEAVIPRLYENQSIRPDTGKKAAPGSAKKKKAKPAPSSIPSSYNGPTINAKTIGEVYVAQGDIHKTIYKLYKPKKGKRK
jgi:hypothetical protein